MNIRFLIRGHCHIGPSLRGPIWQCPRIKNLIFIQYLIYYMPVCLDPHAGSPNINIPEVLDLVNSQVVWPAAAGCSPLGSAGSVGAVACRWGAWSRRTHVCYSMHPLLHAAPTLPVLWLQQCGWELLVTRPGHVHVANELSSKIPNSGKYRSGNLYIAWILKSRQPNLSDIAWTFPYTFVQWTLKGM